MIYIPLSNSIETSSCEPLVESSKIPSMEYTLHGCPCVCKVSNEPDWVYVRELFEVFCIEVVTSPPLD